MDLSDRDYFTHFRDHDDSGIFIGAPRRDQVSGEWTFFLGRRISGPRREFLGVLLALIEIRYFEDFYQAINLRGGSVAIFRDDGTMVARYPRAEDKMGEKLASVSPWYDMVAKGGGSYRTPGYVDGWAAVTAGHPA